jgi:inorganic pyrophosphatase
MKYESETQQDGSQDLTLDRIIDVPYPFCYGAIEGSKIQQDGDLCDAFLLSDHVPLPNSAIDIQHLKLIALIQYIDKGQKDNKYLYTFKKEFLTKSLKYYCNAIDQVRCFLIHYKDAKNLVKKIHLTEELEPYIEKIRYTTGAKTELVVHKDLTVQFPLS